MAILQFGCALTPLLRRAAQSAGTTGTSPLRDSWRRFDRGEVRQRSASYGAWVFALTAAGFVVGLLPCSTVSVGVLTVFGLAAGVAQVSMFRATNTPLRSELWLVVTLGGAYLAYLLGYIAFVATAALFSILLAVSGRDLWAEPWPPLVSAAVLAVAGFAAGTGLGGLQSLVLPRVARHWSWIAAGGLGAIALVTDLELHPLDSAASNTRRRSLVAA